MRFTLLLIFGGLLLAGCTKNAPPDQVVVYTSQDQFFSEPILKEFTSQTGIEVKALYDSESAKTAGLAHRLRYERGNPAADLFWNNEELHTRMLAREKVLGSWKAVGYRTRRLVVNTNLLALSQAPSSLLELTNSSWSGKFAVAYPLFGTTGYHFLALRQHWGEEKWKRWCHGLVRNGSKVVDGNSVVVKMVGSGEAAIGMTDSDDIIAGQKQGYPIVALPLWPESVAIPNTVALVADAPNGGNAEVLLDYLSSPPVLQKLRDAGALEGLDIKSVQDQTLQVDWAESLDEFQEAANFLRLIFVRS